MMTKILVVDDEQDLCEILRFNLESEGFSVSTAGSAEEALGLMECADRRFDLILLDVMMERMSGIEMAQTLRQQGDETPIIFLTAMGSHDDQLAGFAAGADDYVAKPFAFDTVLARVKAVLKRSRATVVSPTPLLPHYQMGNLEIDTEGCQVYVGGSPVSLTHREYLTLCLLASRTGTYLTRSEIMANAWPNDALVNDRSVDVHIARLRKKLGPEGRRLVSRTGFGYTLVR